MDYITKNMLATVVIALFAVFGYFYTPKSRSAFGYKTPRSLKNDATWNFANGLAKKLFVLVAVLFIIAQIVLYKALDDHRNAYRSSFWILTFLSLAVIPVVEVSLFLKFDKEGKPLD